MHVPLSPPGALPHEPAGLTEELLQQLLLDDKKEAGDKEEEGDRKDSKKMEQDWRAVGAAVEGVMQVRG